LQSREQLDRLWTYTTRTGVLNFLLGWIDEEFRLARALIEARTRAGLSQSQLARRMKTSPSYIARIEGGKVRPSTNVLGRFAEATGTRLVFEPHSTR
jgi:predicted transcriptional regulator